MSIENVYGNAQVYENARVFGNAQVYGDARVFGDAQVYGDAQVFGDARVSEDAQVYAPNHIIVISGYLRSSFTVYRTNDGHRVQAGCQNFRLTDDVELIARTHEWVLPRGWETVRDGLLASVKGWHSDAA